MRVLGPIHIVQMWPPFDMKAGNSVGADSTTQSRTISMKNYDHAAFLFNFGVTGAVANGVLNIYACSTIAGANAVAIDFGSFRTCQAALATVSDLAGDTWGDHVLMATNASDLNISDMAASDAWNPNDSDADSITSGMAMIEINAADVYNAADDGISRDCLYITVSDTTDSFFCSCQALLMKENRYQKKVPPTAILD